MLLHSGAPVADAPLFLGEWWCGRAGCRQPLGPSRVLQDLDSEVRLEVHKEVYRVGPRAEDGICAQGTQRHPHGLEKQVARGSVFIVLIKRQ